MVGREPAQEGTGFAPLALKWLTMRGTLWDRVILGFWAESQLLANGLLSWPWAGHGFELPDASLMILERLESRSSPAGL